MNNLSRFDRLAATWDTPARIELARAVGEAIISQTPLTRDINMLDYGAGTGLLSLFLLPRVGSVTAMDSSPGMLKVLEEKIAASALTSMHLFPQSLKAEDLPKGYFQLITSSMVLHHIRDVEQLLTELYTALCPGGTICIADLDTEPHCFHDEDAAGGVYHFGFDRNELAEKLKSIGFSNIYAKTAHVIRKPVPAGGERDFPVFLITGRKS